MVSQGHALSRDELIRTLTAYSGITTANGAGDGTTLVDTALINNPFIAPASIPDKAVLIMSGGSRGQDKGAAVFNNGTGAITLQGTGFNTQIVAGTLYRILNISSVELDVATINTKIGTNTDPVGTTTLFAWLLKLFEHGGQGGFYYGKVTQIDDATHFRVAGLTGFGDAYFANTYRVYVVRDAAGLGAAPQGEMQPCSAYESTDGIFTYTAFTAALAVDDEVLLIHERIAEIADLITYLGYEGATALADKLTAARAGYLDELNIIPGATGIFHEQADVALNVSVDNSENDLFDLSTASTRYIVRGLRVKCTDPGAGETVTIRLYELINDGATLVDSFIIDHDNYMTYFSLMDMFGVPHLAGDDLHVVAIGSVAGPVTLTGQYSHAKTNI